MHNSAIREKVCSSDTEIHMCNRIKSMLDRFDIFYGILHRNHSLTTELCVSRVQRSNVMKDQYNEGFFAEIKGFIEKHVDNKAAFITIGWSEAVSLGIALGARASTFFGLAGLGDLIATGNSPLSRNHYVGYELGKGRPLSDIIGSMSNVVEGVDTAVAAYGLAKRLQLKVPIINLVYSVLFESLPPAEISRRFRNDLKPDSVV